MVDPDVVKKLIQELNSKQERIRELEERGVECRICDHNVARVAELEAALLEIKQKADGRVVSEKIPFGYAEISNLARAALYKNNE